MSVFTDLTDLWFLSVALMSSHLNVNYNFWKAGTSTSSRMLDWAQQSIHDKLGYLISLCLMRSNFCSGIGVSIKGQF